MPQRSINQAIRCVRERSTGLPLPCDLPLTINLHPDAPFGKGTMIEGLATAGVYRSQFETRTSNGGLTAHPGGDRWNWESRIFGAAYDQASPAHRPKYGALNHTRSQTGGSPRFGSYHLRLRPHVLSRTTFCHPDSHFGPTHFGVVDRMDLIERVEAAPASDDPLDRYIEAHFHGQISVAEDIEAIILDPSYRNTDIEQAAHALGCRVEWHSGYRMSVSHVADCAAYRSPAVATVAEALMQDGVLTPREIGFARMDDRADWQILKQVWHCVARFGKPA